MLLAEDLVNTRGKMPAATLYAQIITENARAEQQGKPVRFVRHGKGMVGLAAWLEPGVQHELLSTARTSDHTRRNDPGGDCHLLRGCVP